MNLCMYVFCGAFDNVFSLNTFFWFILSNLITHACALSKSITYVVFCYNFQSFLETQNRKLPYFLDCVNPWQHCYSDSENKQRNLCFQLLQ